MLPQVLKQTARTTLRANTRAFSAVSFRSNLLQDVYIRELKNYKPQPISANDSKGNVIPWAVPTAPQPPKLEAETTEDLDAYKTSAVEVEVAAAEGETSTENPDDWFVLEEIHDSH